MVGVATEEAPVDYQVRRQSHGFSSKRLQGTCIVERMFCRLKDFRRIATRHDKRADIYLSTILLATAITLVDQLSPDPS
jgi:transposase